MGRDCLIKLAPPKGHGVIVTVIQVDFRNHAGCKDFIKIYNNDEGDRLCGFQDVGVNGKSYYSNNELKIMYHTSEKGLGFSNGFKLIFTVTKLGTECSSPDDFKCDNSHCVWAGVRCDGINNCGDSSDERSTSNSKCRMYQQLYKNFLSRLADITPVAIIAVVLGIVSFIAILVVMCIYCCRTQPEIALKPPLIPLRPNAGYAPLPGYSPLPGFTYGSPSDLTQHSPASAPTYYSASCPYVQQKAELRCDRPPPYNAQYFG